MNTDAFLLLTVPDATLSTPTTNQTGTLGLECVTVGQDVYLVMRLGSIELPIDPQRVIILEIRSSSPTTVDRTYLFRPTDVDPAQLVLQIPVPQQNANALIEDLETFDGILTQYADFRGVSPTEDKQGMAEQPKLVTDSTAGDLRGRLVLVNEDNGEVVGEFADKDFRVREDPSLRAPGHENDPVVIEIAEDAQAGTPLEAFARNVPPDQQDWMTKSATIISHAISGTTNLLLTVITSASNYYISHSAPSPHHPKSPSRSPSPGGSSSATSPTPPPPRALVFLTSETTRKGLGTVHAFSGQAVKVSHKTLSLIDKMIARAIGANPPKAKAGATGQAQTPVLSPLASPPPPYSSTQYLSPTSPVPPTLPPRRTPSPTPKSPSVSASYSYPTPTSPAPPQPPSLPPRNLTRKARLVLSADLLLSTLDHSAKQLLTSTSSSLTNMVQHKYGDEAAESAGLVGGSVKNLGIVYIDMAGMGRKALVRRVAKTYIKSKVSSHKA